MMTHATRLRKLLQDPGLLVVPGAYDCLSALLAERAGFEVLFTSGFGISASTIGRPDVGLLTASEMLTAVGHICRTVSLPVVADLDTGYGGPLNVIRTVEDAVGRGVAGIILEDQDWPKRCGHFEGKRVVPPEDHVARIRAAVHARGDSGLVIIGRTDARAVSGLDDAIRRGQAYHAAGADVVFIEAPESVAELKAIVTAFPGVPLMANMIRGGKTPYLPADELKTMGFKLGVYALSGLFAAVGAMAAGFRHLRAHGTSAGFGGEGFNFQEFEALVGLEGYRDLEKRFGAGVVPE